MPALNVLPTRRLLWLLAATAPLFLVSARVAVWVDLLLLALLAMDGMLAPRGGALGVERRWPRRVSLGAEAEVA
ncbi:MAG TPA: hypothetical protein VEW03_04970, partial [Longimicrobiaceae bacterium]|nr:hypothetical protein [Longimicrobiaceae bacterium]